MEHLHVQRCSHLLPAIAKGLNNNNTTLKILDLSRHTYNASELRPLWNAIQQDTCLEIISFRGASFVLDASEHDVSVGSRIAGADYLTAAMPEMAGLARVLFVNRSKWLQGRTSPTAAWPQLIERIRNQFVEGGLGQLETLYYLLRHRLDWIPTSSITES